MITKTSESSILNLGKGNAESNDNKESPKPLLSQDQRVSRENADTQKDKTVAENSGHSTRYAEDDGEGDVRREEGNLPGIEDGDQHNGKPISDNGKEKRLLQGSEGKDPLSKEVKIC